MARKKMWVTHDKATRELGYAPGPCAGGAAAGGGVVSCQRLRLRCGRILVVAAESFELKYIRPPGRISSGFWPRTDRVRVWRVRLQTASRQQVDAILNVGLCGALIAGVGNRRYRLGVVR